MTQAPKTATRSLERRLGDRVRILLPVWAVEAVLFVLKMGWAALFGGLLLLAIIGSVITFKAVTVETQDGDKIGKWAWKPLFFILAANFAFGILLGGLPSIGVPAMGLIVGIYALTFIASLAGQEFHAKSVFILATVLAIGSYVAFVWALKLQFPVWPSFITG